MMEKLDDAINVTAACINKVGNGDEIKTEKRLHSFGIDNSLIPSLKAEIGTNDEIGLPSVKPDPYTIDLDLLNITENSTVNQVINKVFDEAVKAVAANSVKKSKASNKKIKGSVKKSKDSNKKSKK